MDYPIELSLDNETLDVVSTACVLTVGGVLFRGREVLETIHFSVELQPQIDMHRTISASTFEWWMSQGKDAQAGLKEGPEVKISTGRAILREMGAKCEAVWARPGMFDLPMLRSLFGQDIWDDEHPKLKNHGYQKERDLGTLVREWDPGYSLQPTFVGTPHNAMHDARHHHVWLMNIREHMDRARQLMIEQQPSPAASML